MSFPQQNFPGSMHGGMTGPPAPKLSVNEAMSQAQRELHNIQQQQQQQQHHGHHRASNVGASDLEPTVSSSLSSSPSSSITSSSSSSSTGNLVGPDHPIFHQDAPTDGNNHGGDKARPSHPMSGGGGGGTHDPERPEAHFDPYGPPKTSANRSDPNPDTTVRPKFTSDESNIDFKF